MCAPCYTRWKKYQNPQAYYDRQRAIALRRFEITPEQYDKIFVLQGGVCKICLRPPGKKKLHVDHDHKTERVRGLLCWKCNYKLLGTWSDPDLLLRAREYVKGDFDGRYV